MMSLINLSCFQMIGPYTVRESEGETSTKSKENSKIMKKLMTYGSVRFFGVCSEREAICKQW